MSLPVPVKSGRADRIDEFVNLEALRTTLPELPLQMQKILLPRFYGDYTQAEIAHRFGLSQMQISRLITSACIQLRETIHDERRLAMSK